MIYLMTGSRYCEYWDNKFTIYSKALNPVRIACADFHLTNFEANSNFIGRINQYSNISFEDLKSKCFDISFPSLNVFRYYDDKFKQVRFFEEEGIKTPHTKILWSLEDFKNDLNFPFVCKLSHGASSKNVWLANSIKDLKFPCLIQEYIRSDFDYRVTVVGDHIFGFKRKNRKNDFRASGSGLIQKIETIPHWEMLYSLCKRNNFESMAFDLIDDYVIEMSYTYNADILKHLDFFVDAKTGSKIPVNYDIPYIIFNKLFRLFVV